MTTKFRNVKGQMVGVRLPDNVIVILRARLAKSGLTMSAYLRRIIENYVCRKR